MSWRDLVYTHIFIFLSVFAPGPVLFGWLYDGTCQLWSRSCRGRGQCLLYDTHSYGKVMHGVPFVFQVTALLLSIVAVFLVNKRIKNIEKMAEEESLSSEEKYCESNRSDSAGYRRYSAP